MIALDADVDVAEGVGAVVMVDVAVVGVVEVDFCWSWCRQGRRHALPSLSDSGARRGRRHAPVLPIPGMRRQGPP